MIRNLGTYDRALRMLIGAAILSLVLVGPKSPWALLGAIPFATGLFGSCPIYLPFGFDSRKFGPKKKLVT